MSCFKQGIEPFKITFRFRFRFGKFYFKGSDPVQVQQKIFFGFSSGSGSAKNFFSGLVPVQVQQFLFLGVQFRFSSGSGSEYIFFYLFLTSVRTVNTISYLMLSWALVDALPGGVVANSRKHKKYS